jgi:GH25 family lysozyme M1 (1,4-beta-N-acetylmuramidase)
MPVLGIDVSHYNGDVDWDEVARSDAKFAYMKASDGNTWVDGTFERNWRGSRDVGLLHGAYHYARPGSNPEAQATHFASVVGTAAWGELPPALDLETTNGLETRAVVAWTLAFLLKADALFGRRLMVYTGGLWRRTLGDPEVPEMRSRLLWTARYGSKDPIVPRSWAGWDFWQFTDGGSGEIVDIPGVDGPCDCDRYRGTLDELKALADVSVDVVPVAPGPGPDLPGANKPRWPGRFLVWPHVPTVRGQDVRTWQTRMRETGFAVEADGAYGPESKRACIALQRLAGLEPDGIVGMDTWGATFAAESV